MLFFPQGRAPRVGAAGGMRDLPGFYWDEERQRYFALAQENVARDLSRTHLAANAPENRRARNWNGSSSRARDASGDSRRRKKKRSSGNGVQSRAGENAGRAQNTNANASASASVPIESNPTGQKPCESVLETLRARSLGVTHLPRFGRRASAPSDIKTAARTEHLKGLTLVGETRANTFLHGFELCVEPLRVGSISDYRTGDAEAAQHINHSDLSSVSYPDRILLAGAFLPGTYTLPHGHGWSFVKRLRSVDGSGKRFGYKQTLVHRTSYDAEQDCAFSQDRMGSSFRARETHRVRAVRWSYVKNAGVAAACGLDGYASDDANEEPDHSHTGHACLSTSLSGDGSNRDACRPPGGCAALTLSVGGGRRACLNEMYQETPGNLCTLFFAAGDAPGRDPKCDFKNTHAGFFDAQVSPTGVIACACESQGLLLYDVRDGCTVNRVQKPKVRIPLKGDTVAVACDVDGRGDTEFPIGGSQYCGSELFAVGLRDGTLGLVDNRTPKPSYFVKQNNFSFVTDVKSLRTKPGCFVAASADGGLHAWDVRQTKTPYLRFANGSGSNVFDTKRRSGVDSEERCIVFDQTHVVPALPNRPSTKREVEKLVAWDLETGNECWRREKTVAGSQRPHGWVEGTAEVASAVAVETEPGIRVWAGSRKHLRLYVPNQVLGEDGNVSFGCWS